MDGSPKADTMFVLASSTFQPLPRFNLLPCSLMMTQVSSEPRFRAERIAWPNLADRSDFDSLAKLPSNWLTQHH